jgi:hypothetical protein
MHEKTLANRPGTGRWVSVAVTTDLHMHGLIVESADTFDDHVFTQVINPAHQAVPPGVTVATPVHPGNLVRGAGQLQIQRRRNYPFGVTWFHPDLYGMSLSQVTAGLAGALTIGSAAQLVLQMQPRGA